jgi:hypothetical protein
MIAKEATKGVQAVETPLCGNSNSMRATLGINHCVVAPALCFREVPCIASGYLVMNTLGLNEIALTVKPGYKDTLGTAGCILICQVSL